MLIPTCILLLGLSVYSLAEMEGFIVGGGLANIESYPHSAFLSVNCVTDKGNRQGWICGASVLNQKLLLSAGHCLYTCTYESRIGVNLGSEHRLRGQTHSGYSFVVHEGYNPLTNNNDIALLRVDTPLTLNKKASRVALLRKPPYNEQAKVAGWGMIDEESGAQSNWLKVVDQRVWDRNYCLRIYGYMPKGTLCASAKDKNDYASRGDSGSALIVRGYIQIGLVSYKLPAQKNIVVYTDVGYHYNWIKAYSKKLNCIE